MMMPAPVKLLTRIDEEALRQWQQEQDAVVAKLRTGVPAPVADFIEALAAKLGTLEKRGVTRTLVSVRDLRLSAWPGAETLAVEDYVRVDVPVLCRVDHRVSMLRWYHRKGAKALIDWCRAHAKAGPAADALIDLFETEVLKQPMSTRLQKKLAA